MQTTTNSVFVTSKPIALIPYLTVFLGALVTKKLDASVKYVAGWGAKRSGLKAALLANKHHCSALYLEDGFLRSYGTGDSYPPISLIVDTVGIYYDCNRPSDLENKLNSNFAIENLDEVSSAQQMIIDNKLSKYNHAPMLVKLDVPLDFNLNIPYKKILVIDQTKGDKSVSLGSADQSIFNKMLEQAYAENPGAVIYVKTHPEVSSGKKRGYLSYVRDNKNTVVLRDAVNPISLLEQMDHVYVVSSTMGFEALLMGKKVSVFGLPWYAGWGVTNDMQSIPRRRKIRTVEDLFYVAYFEYSRYLNPVSKTIGTIFDAINWLILQKSEPKVIKNLST